MKKQSTKIILLAAGIFLLAAGCGKQTSQPISGSADQQVSQSANKPISGSANQQIQPSSQSATTTAVKPGGQTQIKQNPAAKGYQPQQAEDPNNITVYQTVDGSNLNQPSYMAANGQWALALLKSTHTVTVKSYGSMGEFVTGIDGVTSDNKHFWEFFVNGKSSNVGASSYKLQSGDKIEWKLSEIK